MNAKEKAKSLYVVFLKCSIEKTPTNIHFNYKPLAKQCALIAVDEILKIGDEQYYNWSYWDEVKQEIQKL